MYAKYSHKAIEKKLKMQAMLASLVSALFSFHWLILRNKKPIVYVPPIAAKPHIDNRLSMNISTVSQLHKIGNKD